MAGACQWVSGTTGGPLPCWTRPDHAYPFVPAAWAVEEPLAGQQDIALRGAKAAGVLDSCATPGRKSMLQCEERGV